MKLSVVTAVCGAIDITHQWVDETIGQCSAAHELVIVSNGNTAAENDWLSEMGDRVRRKGWRFHLLRYEDPIGSTRAFNAGLSVATGEIVAMLHNDLMVRELGWDRRVIEFFEHRPDAGVVGFHGSRELGHPFIYRVPYELVQLARGDNWSNLEDAESHGQRTSEPMEVVTLDGMALIARRDRLEKFGGMDERYVHHLYDHALCLTARQYGYRNYLLPVHARHISGQTANAPRYNEALKARGIAGDQQIHRDGHRVFYDFWQGSGLLPARVR